MSTSTTDRSSGRRSCRPRGRRSRGLVGAGAGTSLIELLVGLSLALCLALGIAPLWGSFERRTSLEADASIWTLQGRVAAARFEKDLRLAGCAGCPFPSATAVLQGTPSQVVLLEHAPDSSPPVLIEWELANGSLMRRSGPCPALLPARFSHSLFSDSKTMLADVDVGRSQFSYSVGTLAAAAPVALTDLLFVDGVGVQVVRMSSKGVGNVECVAWAPVGR